MGMAKHTFWALASEASWDCFGKYNDYLEVCSFYLLGLFSIWSLLPKDMFWVTINKAKYFWEYSKRECLSSSYMNQFFSRWWDYFIFSLGCQPSPLQLQFYLCCYVTRS